MSASDIQATMSTKIKVDQQEAANQVENLTNKFKDLTAQWKAEQATAKASGDSVGAAKARNREDRPLSSYAAHTKLRSLSKKGGK